MRVKLLAIIVLAAICGGSGPPFAKVALEVFQSFTLVMLRFFFATLILLPFIYNSAELNISTFKKQFWVAIVGALNPIILFVALPFTKASVSPLLYAAIPGMTAIYFFATRSQKISLRQFLGICLGLAGVVTIVILPLIENNALKFHELYGNLLICLAVVAFFAYGVMSKAKQTDLATSPLVLTFYFSLVTFIVSIPFATHELATTALSPVALKHILAALETGVLGTAAFYLSYQYALKLSTELTAALFTYLQPVFTILFSIWLLGEQITPAFIIGAILAVVGAQLASGVKFSKPQ